MSSNLPHPSETTLVWFRFNTLYFQDKRGLPYELRLPYSLDGVDESLVQALDHLPQDYGLIFDRQPNFSLFKWNILDDVQLALVKSGQPLDKFLDGYASKLDHRVRELGVDRFQTFDGHPITPPIKKHPSERFTLFFGHKPVSPLAEAA
jgi:hypothetical protein